jgi:hypothetical protein
VEPRSIRRHSPTFRDRRARFPRDAAHAGAPRRGSPRGARYFPRDRTELAARQRLASRDGRRRSGSRRDRGRGARDSPDGPLNGGFACAARKGHPSIDGALDLDSYVQTPHLLITLGDDTGPTWIDQALTKLGRKRHVAARVRYFMTAPLIVARSDLLLTGPSTLIRYFAELVPLQVLRPPIDLPTYPEEAYWHQRFDEDPAHTWLRNLVKKTARRLRAQGTAAQAHLVTRPSGCE